MKETAFRTLLGTNANRRNTTVKDVKIHVESILEGPGLTEDEKDNIRKNSDLAIEYLRETKTMFCAVNGVSVYGVSFEDAEESIDQANEWWDENGEDRGEIDSVDEVIVPADAEYSDFSSCAQISDYKEVAEKMIEELEE